jgi:hypothetical protein
MLTISEFCKRLGKISEDKPYYIPLMKLNYSLIRKGDDNYNSNYFINYDIKFETTVIKIDRIRLEPVYFLNGNIYVPEIDYCWDDVRVKCFLKENDYNIFSLSNVFKLIESVYNTEKECDDVVRNYNNSSLLIKIIENNSDIELDDPVHKKFEKKLSEIQEPDIGHLIKHHLVKILLKYESKEFSPFLISLSKINIKTPNATTDMMICINNFITKRGNKIFTFGLLSGIQPDNYVYTGEQCNDRERPDSKYTESYCE